MPKSCANAMSLSSRSFVRTTGVGKPLIKPCNLGSGREPLCVCMCVCVCVCVCAEDQNLARGKKEDTKMLCAYLE